MMKKLLLILLFFPMIGFGQGQVNCSLLDVTDVVIDNTNMIIDIAVYNGDTMDTHYPFIAYTIDDLGDTIQSGNMNWFVTPALDTSWYSCMLSSSVIPAYPLSIYFVYSNFISNPATEDTCILTYNLTPTAISDDNISSNRNVIKITDLLGQETPYRKNTPLFYIFDDGTVEKRIVIE